MISPHSRNIGSKTTPMASQGTAMVKAGATQLMITSSMAPAKAQLSTAGHP